MYQFSLHPRPVKEHWRNLANLWHISPQAKERLEWMIFYHTIGKENARFTASYFGITPKTFHKWKKRFNPHFIQSLEEKSKAPRRTRVWEVTPEQEERVISLRTKHLKFGKKKLKVIYRRQYQEEISTWKIERVIRKHNLFPDNVARKQYLRRRKNLRPKLRINQVPKINNFGFLWHIDAIIIWWYGVRRVIFTALEGATKIAYARVYNTNSSGYAEDFLKRLMYLVSGKVEIVHSDNGSEFAGDFTRACLKLGILQAYSRPKTPKDNPALERFNWTVQDEWLGMSEVGLDDIGEANQDLTNWLIEYNSYRPHESLDYQTPLEYAYKHYFKVLPMWPASTII
jgi:putative transposase